MKYCFLVLEKTPVLSNGRIELIWQSILSDELYDTEEEAKLESQQVMGASPHECREYVLSWDAWMGVEMHWSSCDYKEEWLYSMIEACDHSRIAVQIAQLYIRHGQIPYCWYDESDEDTCYTTVQDEAKAQTS